MVRCIKCLLGKTWDYNSYCWNCGSPQRCTFELIVSRIFKSGTNDLCLRFSILDGFIKNNISYWDNFLLLEKNRPENLPGDLINSLDRWKDILHRYELANNIIQHFKNNGVLLTDHFKQIKDLDSFFDHQEIIEKAKGYETKILELDKLKKDHQYHRLLEFFNQNEDLKIVSKQFFSEVKKFVEVRNSISNIKKDDSFYVYFNENFNLINSDPNNNFFKPFINKYKYIKYLKEMKNNFSNLNFNSYKEAIKVIQKISEYFTKYFQLLDVNGELFEFSYNVHHYAFKFSSCIESLVAAQPNVSDLNKLIVDKDFISKLLPVWPFIDETKERLIRYLNDKQSDADFLIRVAKYSHGVVKLIWGAGSSLVKAFKIIINNSSYIINRSDCEINSNNLAQVDIPVTGISPKSPCKVKLYPIIIIFKSDGSEWLKAIRTKELTKEISFG